MTVSETEAFKSYVKKTYFRRFGCSIAIVCNDTISEFEIFESDSTTHSKDA